MDLFSRNRHRISALDSLPVPVRKRLVRDFTDEFDTRGYVYDFGFLISLPILLLGLFWVPSSLKFEFVFAYQRPTVLTAFTAHFIHFTVKHLVSNILAYCVIVPITYTMSLVIDYRRTFFVTFVALLLAIPFAVSVLNLVYPRPRIGYGFSAVIMAFLGLMTFLMWPYLRNQFDLAVLDDSSPAFFFSVIGVVSIRVLPRSGESLIIIVLALLGMVVYLWPVFKTFIRRKVPEIGKCPSPQNSYFIALVLLIVLLFPVIATDPSPTSSDVMINQYAHMMGYCLGFIAPYTTFRVFRITID